MPRKQHKTRNDSLTGLRQAAQADEPASVAVPDVAGLEVLNDLGKRTFANLYRSAPDKWTEADLNMTVELAFVTQQMADNRILCMMTPAIVTHVNGSSGRSPIHAHQQELSRQMQALARDLGLRTKDGIALAASSVKAPDTASASPDTPDNVTSFEDFLNNAINGG
ncbi:MULTISPECIES: hypothetical protein [unclassified Ruegeria]|uniref:hypothetical protein n=1 Tax=unclassified Ruegeria TaxID=2625375 RepID=UPI001488D57C|nr:MULTISPECIES: hypothetical protein [unclassified Ruegeria]NOD75991.1 hypothetical protein [Ruegeria sp. HKCCD4332]NOD88722.1 hypothetical protein [Ruegeria sp. HKCCD4318]NOD92447.1 hypothetical protein [Ruegeria sp. HKCCD4884]NOE16117.1 hypothetical protein [Ruegeria sp. HKCCD4318-2]NOG09786.1 hypothetical protein [Ruegeria sp. HKCCD4315]